MKNFTILMVFFFTSFLVLPTFVCIINNDADISVFYEIEEESKKEISIEEVKIIQELFSFTFIPYLKVRKNKISIYKEVIVSNNYITIFSPPPEFI